jgi:hypothetical protein
MYSLVSYTSSAVKISVCLVANQPGMTGVPNYHSRLSQGRLMRFTPQSRPVNVLNRSNFGG